MKNGVPRIPFGVCLCIWGFQSSLFLKSISDLSSTTRIVSSWEPSMNPSMNLQPSMISFTFFSMRN